MSAKANAQVFLQIRGKPVTNDDGVCKAITEESKLSKACQGAECTFDECCECKTLPKKCTKETWQKQCKAGCHDEPKPNVPTHRHSRAQTLFLLQLSKAQKNEKCGKIKPDEHIQEHECKDPKGCTFDDCCDEEKSATCANESEKWKTLCKLECPDDVHECAYVNNEEKQNQKCKNNVCSYDECCEITRAVDMPCRFSADLKFDFDSDVLNKANNKILYLYVCFLQNNPAASIMVQGHTDTRGSAIYNLKLGYRRAVSVYNRLKELAGEDWKNIEKQIEDPRQ